MRTNYMIKYDFKGNYKSTIAEKIHVGFTTTDPKGFLLGAYSDVSKEFLTLMVSNSGHLRLVFDFGFERQERVFTEQNFLTGQFHDVRIERFDQGRKMMMKIDNYEPQIYDFTESLKSSADAQFNNINYLYIGRNETMREGFVGCISRVEFDEIIPLKLLFQEDPQSNIQVRWILIYTQGTNLYLFLIMSFFSIRQFPKQSPKTSAALSLLRYLQKKRKPEGLQM